MNPMQMMFPMFYPQGREAPQQSNLVDVGIPVRVSVAMQLLSHLADKESDKVGESNPFGGNAPAGTVSGIKLTTEEIAARCTALDLIGRYLAGRLKPDRYEKLRADHARIVIGNSLEGGPDDPKTLQMVCPVCRGSVTPDCLGCGGKGVIMLRIS